MFEVIASKPVRVSLPTIEVLILSLIVAACLPATAGQGTMPGQWEERPSIELSLREALAMGLHGSPKVEIQQLGPEVARGGLIASHDFFVPQLELKSALARRERLINQFELESERRLRSSDDRITALSIDDPGFGGLDIRDPSDIGELESINTDPAFDFTDETQFRPREYFEDLRNSRAAITQRLPWGAELRAGIVELKRKDTFTSQTTPTGIPLSPIFPEQQEFLADISIVQPLWKDFGTDVALSQIRIRRADYEKADAEFLFSINRYVADVAKAYMKLKVLREAVDTYSSSVDASSQLLEQTQALHDEGLTDVVELSRTRASLAESRNGKLRAISNVFSGQNELLALVLPGYDPDLVGKRILTTTPMEDRLPENLNTAYQVEALEKAYATRPEILIALADMRRASARRVALENEARPRLDLSASYGWRGLGENMSDAWDDLSTTKHAEWTVALTFKVPLGTPLHTGRRIEARSQLRQAELALETARLDVSLSIETAIGECRLSAQRVAVTQELADESKQAFRVEQVKLEEGKSTPALVREIEKDYLFARLRELEARYHFQEALIDLSLANDRILEEFGVRLDPAPTRRASRQIHQIQ